MQVKSKVSNKIQHDKLSILNYLYIIAYQIRKVDANLGLNVFINKIKIRFQIIFFFEVIGQLDNQIFVCNLKCILHSKRGDLKILKG